MKNNHILSVAVIMFLLAGASVVSMEPKRYNGTLTEEQALQKALNESIKESEKVEKNKREQIAQDAALAIRLQRQSIPQNVHGQKAVPLSVKTQSKRNGQNVRNQQRSQHNNQTSKKQTNVSNALDSSGNIQLPKELQNKHLTHLAVSRQNDSTSCGYHATFNAWALQELITREGFITGKDVQQLALQHHRLILPDHLLEIGYSNNPDKPDYIIELAQRVGLTDNLYFLNYRTEGNTFGIAGVRDNLNHSYVEFLETIRYRDDEGVLVGHIICNYNNGHWTTFSVVKRPNHVPEIYYMNSTNASLDVDSSAKAVAKHILALVS